MRDGRIEVAGQLVTRAQLRVLRAIDEMAAAPQIGEFHRMTELRLEGQGLIRRIARDTNDRVPAWAIADDGRQVLDALYDSDALPRAADPAGRSLERS